MRLFLIYIFQFMCFASPTLEGQNNVVVKKFYSQLLGKNSQFSIDLPFPCRVKKGHAKIPDSLPMTYYTIKPLAKEKKLKISLSISACEWDFLAETNEGPERVVEQDANSQFLLVKVIDNDLDRNLIYSLMIKKLLLKNERYCLVMKVQGDFEEHKKELQIIYTSFKRSIINN